MSDTTDTSGFYSARPRIFLDDVEEIGVSDGVTALLVEETANGLYRCELTVGNWGNRGAGVGYLYFDLETLSFGRELKILIGDGDAEATIFTGSITAIEGRFPQERPPELTILAEDRLQDLRMTRRTRSFEDVTDADIVETIAGDHGLTPDTDLDGPTHRSLAQVNLSDLAFLRERARAVDAEVWIEEGKLRAVSRGRRGDQEVRLTYGQRLRELSVLADLANQCTGFAVSGWDVAAKEGVRHAAEEACLGSELAGDQRGGASVLEDAFGVRIQQIVHQVHEDAAQSQALAEAHFRSGARRFLRGTGVAEGDGRIRVGAKVVLKGLGSLFQGEYHVIETRHTFADGTGFRTHFRCERPGLGA